MPATRQEGLARIPLKAMPSRFRRGDLVRIVNGRPMACCLGDSAAIVLERNKRGLYTVMMCDDGSTRPGYSEGQLVFIRHVGERVVWQLVAERETARRGKE